MWPWLETLGVAGLGGLGALAGCCFSRLRRPWWVLGYLIPLAFVAAFVLATSVRWLEFYWPFRWLMAGRREFALLALVGTMVLTTPQSRLPRRGQRVAVSVFMVLLVARLSVLPFLAPALYGRKLAALATQLDASGVCRQATDYTCGPAAAVTALRRLGFPAEEGELAARCRTNPFSGTAPDILCEVLRKRYGPLGLRCQYRPFASIAELKQAGLTLAVVKFEWLVDHYVTVLEVTDQAVVVGDPLLGRVTLSHQEFAARWRKVGVVLGRRHPN